MKRFTIVLAGLALAALVSGPALGKDEPSAAAKSGVKAAAEPKGDLQWLSLADGLKLAAETKKPVIVDVYTSWCGWCKRMEATTYRDDKVVQVLNANFVLVKMNAESNTKASYKGEMRTLREICAYDWGVTGYPTTVFLKPDGQVIVPLSGFMPADRFAPILRYIGSGAYETMKFEEFIKKNS